MIKKEWTDGRFKSFITSGLRSMFRRYPPKYQVLAEAKVGKITNPKSGRLAEHYLCSSCKQKFPQKEVQVDHIDPVVHPVDGFIDWNTFIDRLLCPKENLQVLCSSCHKTKTQKEKDVRLGKIRDDGSGVEVTTQIKTMEIKKSRKASTSNKKMG